MIDHTGITVSNLSISKAFYSQILATLGFVVCTEKSNTIGFGVRTGHGLSNDPGGEFWIGQGVPITPRLHIAFNAATRAHVDAFYAAGLLAGGIANGAPGLRAIYHATYYAGFILDPDGYNIEAVCHTK